MDDLNFDFYSKYLQGQKEQRPMNKRGLSMINGVLGEAFGKLYVEKYFPSEAKAQMETYISYLKKAFEKRINGLDWMSAETKTKAQEKLANSSVLVVDDCEHQKLFKVEKEQKITGICEVDEVQKIDIIYELLGGSPYDLLLPRNFLIVEGKSEYEFITRIIKKYYSNEYKGLKILFAGGDIVKQQESIEAVDKTLRPLVGTDNSIYKNSLVVLLDKPNDQQQTTYNTFKQGYSYLFDDNRVFELQHHALEEYYPDQWTKTPDEIKQLQAENGGKKKLAIEVAENISQEDFESKMSIIHDALKKCLEKAYS